MVRQEATGCAAIKAIRVQLASLLGVSREGKTRMLCVVLKWPLLADEFQREPCQAFILREKSPAI